MANKEKYVQALEEFKSLLKKFNASSYNDSSWDELRTTINQKRHLVEKLVKRTGAGKLMSISPPPMVGGFVLNNLNPFDLIFNAPYGVNVTYSIIDNIDHALGVITSDENFNLEQEAEKIHVAKELNPKTVFLVHGHDNEVKEQVARFLEKIGLNPVILHEKVNSGLTIIEKFEKYAEASYAIVLITPDDLASSIKNPEVKSLRARQNVILELGYFLAKLGRKNVCAMIKGNVERPSDYDGILYIAYDSEGGWKLLLVKELKEAGLDFDSNKLFI
jgi:predicted nucleotide-binding protein